jgi:hypothetical protein
MAYVAEEDRLLLKVSTSDDQEYRAWCTRRFARILLDRLEAMFESEVDKAQVVPQEARKEVAQIKHSSSVSEQAFQKPYEAEPTSYPFGEGGLLLTRLSYRQEDNDMIVMSLGGESGKGLTLNMDHRLRHQFYEIITRACTRAQWFEDLDGSPKAVVH